MDRLGKGVVVGYKEGTLVGYALLDGCPVMVGI